MSWQSPSSILNEMIDEFQKSTHNLLNISRRDLSTFYNGQYGIVIAKLSKRLESVLSVDREVAVVFSNFTQQQARTIRFARKIITDEDVRLEPTLAIIVHQDPRGNEKLKNWGRQNGLTVLPIRFNDGIPSGEELERALSTELFSHDLFDIRDPVSDDSQFFGRRTEAEELARKLQLGQIRACLGLRRIGKTSIVNRVIAQLRQYHDAISIMVDCSKDAIFSLNASELMWSIKESLNEAVIKKTKYVSVSPKKGSKSISDGSERLIEEIRNCDSMVIIFMDEVDYITPSSPDPNASSIWNSEFNVFWRNFRAVYQELSRDHKQNLSLLISGVSSKWFSEHSINGIENASLLLIPEEYLSPLPRGASMAMIREMSRASGLVLNEDVREKVAEVSADIPFWIRQACSYIHRHIPIERRPLELELDEVVSLLRKFVDFEGAGIARVALKHLFTVYGELEAGVYSCSEGNSSECSKPVLEKLSKYGIIVLDGEEIELSGDMMKAGFEAYLEEETSPPTLISPSPTRDSLGKWAENLAEISLKRNPLEKKLRDVTLNFLRMDSLQNKNKGPVQDRIMKGVSSSRREELRKISSDNDGIIGNFTWLELVNLIEREWRIFESIFPDKRQFKEDCMIINVRPDAHAKPMDQADFALFRRSLDRITDQLNKRT